VGITKVPRFCMQSARSNATRACVSWLHTVGLVHDMWGFSLAALAWPTALWWQHLGRGGSEFLSNSHPQVHTGALPRRSAVERCKRGRRLIWEQGRGDGQNRKLGLLLLVEERRLRLRFSGENNCRLLLCISGGTKKSRGKERKH
jgi:hypothetical protein